MQSGKKDKTYGYKIYIEYRKSQLTTDCFYLKVNLFVDTQNILNPHF